MTFRVTPPADAQLTKAYFHRDDPETDAIYKIDDPQVRDAGRCRRRRLRVRVVYSIWRTAKA